MRIGRLNIHAAMQSYGHNSANPSWLGFAYGSWIPHFKKRANKWYTELFGYWLCFHWSLIWNQKGY
jgi:hypothetical protein